MFLEVHDTEVGNSHLASVKNIDYDYMAEQWVQDFMNDEAKRQRTKFLNVHAANVEQFNKAEDGDNPKCVSILGTFLCELCGRDVRGMKDACPFVPKSERWKINYCS